jgi:hypothetical protein
VIVIIWFALVIWSLLTLPHLHYILPYQNKSRVEENKQVKLREYTFMVFKSLNPVSQPLDFLQFTYEWINPNLTYQHVFSLKLVSFGFLLLKIKRCARKYTLLLKDKPVKLTEHKYICAENKNILSVFPPVLFAIY